MFQYGRLRIPDEDPGPLEEIRRQLSDRFDMVCYMGRPTNVEDTSPKF